MELHIDSAFLSRLDQGGEEAWSLFLTSYADTLFRVIALFTSNYDDRMDMFLFVCSHLKADDMKKLRSFEFRPDAPCRFSTWLTVVVKNLVLDFIRARDGRVRRFRTVESLDESDQLLFDYHISDGRPLEESRQLMAMRHGIKLDPAEATDRAARVHALLSANQRWRLLSRLIEKRVPIPLDPLIDEQDQTPCAAVLSDTRLDPEQSLSVSEADRLLRKTFETMAPRQRLALALRFRDGLGSSEAASLLSVSTAEADRLTRQGVEGLRDGLRRYGISRPDLEGSGLDALWSS